MNKLPAHCLLLLIFWFLAACEDDKKSFQKEQLSGHWELVEGLRDGQPSASFEGAWFEFSDSSMKTNLPIPNPNFSEIETGFALTKDLLLQKPKGVEGIDMKIVSLTDSLLELHFNLRDVPFKLRFKKGIVQKDSIPTGMPVQTEESEEEFEE